ncbi:hypothetical protein BOTBODRAFT_182299 [Botryobasidium botryosum FD-172 SS1]|uniref:Uncharacterized protein n=1 Tax=Botryobasidium botryosum (strain FD-172 SS1) TaxID=930990 RepID=A0A067M287_BOTB1|nr:hypothetical protein BOTBODRAFT_182299 [Botryobasidium botryosum FD-172 SS1]
MTAWLVRREKVHVFACYLEWLGTVDPDLKELRPTEAPNGENVGVGGDENDDGDDDGDDGDDEDHVPEEEVVVEVDAHPNHKLSKNPSKPYTSVETLEGAYGAKDFLKCLKKYVDGAYKEGHIIPSSYDKFDVYNKVAIFIEPFHINLGGVQQVLRDVVRASPAGTQQRKPKPAFFDTALLHVSKRAETSGIQGYEVFAPDLSTLDQPTLGQYILVYTPCFPHLLHHIYIFYVCRNCNSALLHHIYVFYKL